MNAYVFDAEPTLREYPPHLADVDVPFDLFEAMLVT